MKSVTISKPVVLSVAGFDPSAGAGVAADLKTMAACGVYGIAAITSITIQNTQGVDRVEPLPAKVLKDQLEHLLRDIRPHAVKVGMLGTLEHVETLAAFLKHHKLPNRVIDPVFESSSKTPLLEARGIDHFRKFLLPLADCLTPNGEEAARLTGDPVTSIEDMKRAAQDLHRLGSRSVVVTGGHLSPATDVFFDGSVFRVLSKPTVDTRNTHGTGCTFSSAIASFLALGASLESAVLEAKEYVTKALANSYPVGQGRGPLNHFFKRDHQ
ncbi:MAG: bifunctional hydroxymethylpyrimidine kinase/phosphomethylpyrimidine kinase [Acidobacteriia bacterium]|nr:bifunctional hydroxymethylpyrimidine kinase/phosphomethylpyrimidine kinase [Terriglobia bacterium]